MQSYKASAQSDEKTHEDAQHMTVVRSSPLKFVCGDAAILFCRHPHRQQWLSADQLAVDAAQLGGLSNWLLGRSIHD